jgi:hypothetical protein
MSAKTASIVITANLVRAWIVLGLGALIVLVAFMIQTPTSASAATAARPCATTASSVAPAQKCTRCQKCTPCATGSPCPKCS